MELLAWSGACDSLATGVGGAAAGSGHGHGGVSPRRQVLWQLGIATPGRRVNGGVQLSLDWGASLPSAPEQLRELSGWGRDARGLRHLRADRDLAPDGAAARRWTGAGRRGHERRLETLPHGRRVRAGGPGCGPSAARTASGVVFVLLEDEVGVINLVVPPKVYEQHRLLVRTEPLLLVEGKLERYAAGGGVINVLVDRIGSISATGPVDRADQGLLGPR